MSADTFSFRSHSVRGCDALVAEGEGDASSPGPTGKPNGAPGGSRDDGVAPTFGDGASPPRCPATEPLQQKEIKGTVVKDKRLWISVDWSKVSKGVTSGTVTLIGTSNKVIVKMNAFNPAEVTRDSLAGFVEGDGFVSIEAEHYTRKIDAGANRWIKIDDYGRTLSGLRAMAPVDASSATPGKDSPCLEYQLYLFSTGKVEVAAILAPTLNFIPGRGLRYAVSFDDEPPQVVTLVPPEYNARNGNQDWEKSVEDNARYGHTTHTLAKSGYHTLKFWMVDPGVVLQKLVVNPGGVKPSYLGPPESYRRLPGQTAR